MAAIPPNLNSKLRRGTPSDPESLYLKRGEGNYRTVLFYNFPTNAPYYRAAVAAQKRYFEIKPFEPTYFKLLRAASEASLELDRHTGDLVLHVPRRTLTKLVNTAVLNELKSKIRGEMLTLFFPSVVAETMAWVGVLKQLNDIKKRIQNEQLLSKNDSASKQKRFRERLKLVAILTGKSMGGNPWQRQLQLLRNYDNYEPARSDYVNYIRKDLIKAGHQLKTYPTISAQP